MSDNDLGFSEHSDPNEPTIAQQPIVLPAPQGQQPYLQPQQQSPSVQHMAGRSAIFATLQPVGTHKSFMEK